MESIYQRELMIDPSMTDIRAQLACHKAFMLFMDIAAEHAERLGIGTKLIQERKLFWLTVKTRLCFKRRPFQAETVTFSTWPETPDQMRCVRSYSATANGQTLITGKTQWAVMNMATGKLHPVADVFPEGLAYHPTACPEEFASITADFDNAEDIWEYTVRSTDIDLGRHMNNTAYIRAVFDTFTNRQLQELLIEAIDVVFLSPCAEGDKLTIQKVAEDDRIKVRIMNGSTPAFLMQMELRSPNSG